jgi:hypothetical protein
MNAYWTISLPGFFLCGVLLIMAGMLLFNIALAIVLWKCDR